MTAIARSGTLGDVQLMAFTGALNADPINIAAKELGLTRTHVVTGNALEATAYLRENASPEILIVEITDADSAPEQLDKLADFVNPHTKVLVTGKVDSIRFYQWLNDLGIAGYLLQPFSAGELKQAIAKGTPKKVESANPALEKNKKIIAVIGARGGVGTTMIAANIGAIFARQHDHNTAIVDLDPYFGSVALSLDLEPGRGLRDAFEKPDRVDALFLERVMVKPFENLSVFSAEEPLAEPIQTQPNAGEMIFGALREKFTTILVDIPRQMGPLSHHVLNTADHIIIIAEPQITSLRDSLRIKDFLTEQLKRPMPMIILNRVGLSANNELSVKEFTKNLGAEVTAQIPFMHDIIAATGQGELLTYSPKLSPALAPLRKIVQAMIGETESDAKEKTGGLLGRLSGKK